MASPLLPYSNSAILIESEGAIAVTDGRIGAASGTFYLVKTFLQRQQAGGSETGGVKVPFRTRAGTVLPGGSGEYYLYRGYALQYAIVPSTFVLGSSSESSLVYTTVKQQYNWMLPGQQASLRFGNDRILNAQIERSSGKYGGIGIDRIIYNEIGGVEIQVIGGELEN